MGRSRRFVGRIDDKQMLNTAYSFQPQSTIADVINQWGLLPIYYENKFKKVELKNQVHDSIVFQLPIDTDLHEMAEILIGIRDSLERPITYRHNTFIIPTDLDSGFRMNTPESVWKASKDINVDEHFVYNKLKNII